MQRKALESDRHKTSRKQRPSARASGPLLETTKLQVFLGHQGRRLRCDAKEKAGVFSNFPVR